MTLIENAHRTLPPQLAQAIVEKELLGWHVVCAVTGDLVPLSSLKYWSVDRQECYKNAEAALAAFQKTDP